MQEDAVFFDLDFELEVYVFVWIISAQRNLAYKIKNSLVLVIQEGYILI